MQTYTYTAREWLDHYEALAKSSTQGLSRTGPQIAKGYFYSQYKNKNEADFKAKRFTEAMRYLDARWEDFNVDDIAIVGNKEAAASRYLILALYRFFSEMPDDAIGRDVPPSSLILELAIENKREGL